ncbi:MAG: RHS repeat domain-containing protein, partial [Candidatus Saccharimonadales bacterium]
VLFSGGTLPTGTTLYHYDLGGQLLAETTEDGTPLRDYLWHDDEPLAQIDTAGGFETLRYLHTDHLKTPRLATGPGGAILWRWEGEAFGSTVPELASATINLRFPGQYFDAETGLHYNYFRDYDPTIGRYVQSDPIGLAGGLNTYAYTANNPIAFADPLGLIDPFDEPPSRGIGELLDRLLPDSKAKPGNDAKPGCKFIRELYYAGPCKVCWYQCPGYSGPVTYKQAVEKPCPSVGPNGLVDTSEIDPVCRDDVAACQ